MTGIIPLKKQENMTSFLAVKRVRGIVGEKKCGHTGTLDPMATGILPVCIGKATKIADFISLGDKEYEAEFKLGLKTDTLDITGTVVKTSDVSPKKEEVIEVINSFLGKIMQVPPMYSAKKIKGKKLYELARDGIEINRDPVEVEIKEIEILKIDLDENIISIRVLCSKGTYIRSLIDDIGEKLGTYATMTALNRTKSGMFTAEHPKVIDIMDIKKGNVNVIANLIGADKVFMEFPQIILSYNLEIRFKNGIFITLNDLGFKKEDVEEDSIYRVYSTAGEFMALGTMVLNNGNLVLKVLKSFY